MKKVWEYIKKLFKGEEGFWKVLWGMVVSLDLVIPLMFWNSEIFNKLSYIFLPTLVLTSFFNLIFFSIYTFILVKIKVFNKNQKFLKIIFILMSIIMFLISLSIIFLFLFIIVFFNDSPKI